MTRALIAALSLAALVLSFSCGRSSIPESPTSPSAIMSPLEERQAEVLEDTSKTLGDIPPFEPVPLPQPPSTMPVPEPVPLPQPPVPPSSGTGAYLIGAGDIALCGNALERAMATARLMERRLSRTGSAGFTAGDNSQNNGTTEEYRNCYGPTWGRLNVKPTVGNHDDYDEDPKLGHNGTGYYDYFGAAAGPRGLGFYSYYVGTTHVIHLNSEIINRSSAEAAQLNWLRGTLSNSSAQCTVAIFHRPMVSSGIFAAGRMRRIWEVLYPAGVDVVINGHEHLYERFALQDHTGNPDPNGIRQFTVGTGGAFPHKAMGRARNSERVIENVLGVIELELSANSYRWQFLDTNEQVLDQGADQCHGKPPSSPRQQPFGFRLLDLIERYR